MHPPANGLHVKHRPHIRLDGHADDLVRRYQSGESVLSIAKHYGLVSSAGSVSRLGVYRILRERGVELRSQSDQERLKWASMTSAQRRHQVAAAHAAVRGVRRDDPAELKRRALARQGRPHHAHTRFEGEILAFVRGAGMVAVQNLAVDGYNVDIGITEPARIAVEVQASHHNEPRSSIRRERLEHLIHRGYRVLVVYIDQSKRALRLGRIGEQIVAFAQLVSANPSTPGQYGMIGRDGEAVTPQRLDPPHCARVVGF